MKYDFGIDVKGLVFGAAIAGAFIIFGYQYNDWLYPFAAIGLLYAGYTQPSIKLGALIGALAATPIVVLTLQGYMGTFKEGFFTTETGVLTVVIIILLIGAFVGLVGAYTKRSRVKALEQYEQQQKKGKKNKKNKNKK
ncbi:hypothetical protein [Methanobrevibacter sp.]|uniref:hypothetical protein n=1 Tax=Methanobrevibacter sp. TaxID=66852 RepID=UPI00388D3A36